MTVAAVILAASTASAVADVEGVPRVRRLADVAWSGGAVPIIVVAPDPGGDVKAALVGAPVTYVPPAADSAGPIGQILRGIEAAAAEVTDTDGFIVWPARTQWLDAETITSLIEAHGQHPAMVLRPTYDGQPGWPVLVPRAEVARLRGISADHMPDAVIDELLAAGAMEWRIDLGDPGSTHDGATARSELPPFLGPSGPASGHHEWGAAVAGSAEEDHAFEGPALAPFGQADESEDPAIEAEPDSLDDDLGRLEP